MNNDQLTNHKIIIFKAKRPIIFLLMFAPQLNFLLMRRWRLNPPVKVERAFLWRTFWLTFLNFQLFTKLIADCHTSDSFQENIKQFIFRLEWRHRVQTSYFFFLKLSFLQETYLRQPQLGLFCWKVKNGKSDGKWFPMKSSTVSDHFALFSLCLKPSLLPNVIPARLSNPI